MTAAGFSFTKGETMTETDDVWGRAVEAAARVLADDEPSAWAVGCNCGLCATVQAHEALAAALPVLLADLADRIEAESREVEPPWHNDPAHERGRQLGLGYAARLVRSFASEVSR